MSKLAVHIDHFKRGAVGSLGGHNFYKRGERDEHSNQDIDPQRSSWNIPMILPEEGLYQTVKDIVANSTGRVTSASIWVTEWIIYPPEDLQDPYTADPRKLQLFYSDVQNWMREHGFNPLMSVIHRDETTVHAHIDTVPLTQDNRLSRKDVYTRGNLNSIHTELAQHLASRGWDIQRGTPRATKGKAKTVREYKAWAEEEKASLNEQIKQAQEELDEVKKAKEALEKRAAAQGAELVKTREALAATKTELEETKEDLEELRKRQLLPEELAQIVVSKTFGGQVKVKPKDWDAMKDTATGAAVDRQDRDDAVRLATALQEDNDALIEDLKQAQRKKDLEAIMADAQKDPSWIQLILELLVGYFHEEPEAYETFVEYKGRYISEQTGQVGLQYTRMDWALQSKLDEALGTDYAKRDKAAYYARMREKENRTVHSFHPENLPKSRNR